MQSPILAIVEPYFRAASGEAALFELRLRLLAGTLSSIADKPIDITLSKLLDAILEHYERRLKTENSDLLKKACAIRNKLLHCEFSTARQHLNKLTPKARDGGVTRLDTAELDVASIKAKISGVVSGCHVGQVAVGVTATRTLKDVAGWLLECQGAHEFEEAVKVFQAAIAILDRIGDPRLKNS